MGGDVTGWVLPDEEYMACEEGLPENHYYRDMRWMDWSHYETICTDADILLETMGRVEDEDRLHEELGDNMVYTLDLDPEVAPVVAALAASGAVPFTSCSGGAGHYESHPLVGFWAEPALKDLLESAATSAGVRLEAVGQYALIVFHESDSEPLRTFARTLWEKR